MPKNFKLHKPEENTAYKFAVPETGKILSLRYLCLRNDGRLAFQNIETKNVVTLSQKRFSYFYAFCLIEKKKETENGKGKDKTERFRRT